MSRYRIEEPIPTSTTAHIYGPDGQVLGQIYRADDPEAKRIKAWIEAAPESDGVMDGIITRSNDPQLVYRPSRVWEDA